MIIDRYVDRKISRNKDAYLTLHGDLVSSRSGITLHRFLYYAIIISLCAGLALGAAGYLISSLLFIPGLQLQIYNVFHLPVPDYSFIGNMRLYVGIFSFLVAFVIGTFFAYFVMLSYPGMQKNARATKINLTLHNAVSYLYAMRRGGAELLTVFKSISDNADIYGEVAIEFRQVVRDAEYFGLDILAALRNLSLTTPSEKFKDFLEDLISVINSGGNISTYLEARVRLYQDEARFEQKQFLSLLQMVAESYVTVFVAGPLFLIIIMVVMGMVGSSATLQLTAITYLLLPIGAVMFMLFPDMVSIKDEKVERYEKATELKEFSDVAIVRLPGGEEEKFKDLEKYERSRKVKEFLKDPLKWFEDSAERILYVTVPLAVIYLVFLFLNTPHYADQEIYYAVIDDHLIIALLLVLLPYSVFIELWRKKVRSIEGSTPDFLDRLAGINRVGMTIAGAIGILVRANLGLISYEIKRIKRDIDWGASVNDALYRFEKRIKTATIARTVTLITKASEMSGDIGEVLNIASSDARMTETLKKERTGEMFIYTVIIYLAFFVFVFVVSVLNTNFLSIIENMAETGASGASVGASGGAFTQTSTMAVDSFRRLMYHTCLIQAFFSGLIAGQMGEGSVKAGIKHVVILLLIALIIFNLFI